MHSKTFLSSFQCALGSVATLKFGKFETMAPDMALKLEARPRQDKPHLVEYWVHLRDDLLWEPLEPRFFPPGFQTLFLVL